MTPEIEAFRESEYALIWKRIVRMEAFQAAMKAAESGSPARRSMSMDPAALSNNSNVVVGMIAGFNSHADIILNQLLPVGSSKEEPRQTFLLTNDDE